MLPSDLSPEWRAEVAGLMRIREAISIDARFSGGHDEGGFDNLTIHYIDGREEELEEIFETEHRHIDGVWVQIVPLMSPQDYADNQLHALFQGVLDYHYGGFDGGPGVQGGITVNLEAEEPFDTWFMEDEEDDEDYDDGEEFEDEEESCPTE